MLREHRTKAGMTQAHLAEKARVPRPHVSAIEHGHKNAGVKMTLALAKVLGLQGTARDEFVEVSVAASGRNHVTVAEVAASASPAAKFGIWFDVLNFLMPGRTVKTAHFSKEAVNCDILVETTDGDEVAIEFKKGFAVVITNGIGKRGPLDRGQQRQLFAHYPSTPSAAAFARLKKAAKDSGLEAVIFGPR